MSKKLRAVINGYGRIGRCVLRAIYESKYSNANSNSYQNIEIVAINEPADITSITHLTKFDSTHGVFPASVTNDEDNLIINNDVIKVLHAQTPEEINWDELGVDILLECSGQYSDRTDIQRFIDAGCPKVLLSHPGNSANDVDKTIVYGINEDTLCSDDIIVSSASCTTNASVPILDLINKQYGIKYAFLTTLHSVMNDQPLIDSYHNSDLRRTRSAMQSMVPVATGLAQGVERLLPELSNKVYAKSVRVPILNVSAIDLMVHLEKHVSSKEINDYLIQATQKLSGIISYSWQPHASIDFNHNSHSAVIDTCHTNVGESGLANLLIWFDNEWGFANRMLDVANSWWRKINESSN